MQRAVFLVRSLGEILLAGGLFYLGYCLPSAREVQAGFSWASQMTGQASAQVDSLRRQVHMLRALELRALARRMKTEAASLGATLCQQPFDFTVVGTVRDAVGELASGLGELAEGLDPAAAGRLGAGLGESATFLEGVANRTPPLVGPVPEQARAPDALVQDLAVTLRRAARTMEATATRWPELRAMLARLADLLRITHAELDTALTRQNDFEEVLRHTVWLAEGLATILPVVTDQLAAQLDHQDQSLADLGQSITDLGNVLPKYEDMVLRFIKTGRVLLWLVGALILVHAGSLKLRCINQPWFVHSRVQSPGSAIPGAAPT